MRISYRMPCSRNYRQLRDSAPTVLPQNKFPLKSTTVPGSGITALFIKMKSLTVIAGFPGNRSGCGTARPRARRTCEKCSGPGADPGLCRPRMSAEIPEKHIRRRYSWHRTFSDSFESDKDPGGACSRFGTFLPETRPLVAAAVATLPIKICSLLKVRTLHACSPAYHIPGSVQPLPFP